MLAIVIPYYKLTFFEATLESLANQSDQRFKVYVGDDASPEDPTVLLEKYKGKFDFVYHRFESNLGGTSLVKQWERCVALSRDEEWIMILGDDDYLGENVVEEFYSLINSSTENVALIRCKLIVLKQNNSIVENKFEYDYHESTPRFLDRIFSLKETITASEFIFRREMFMKNNGFIDFPMAWFSDYATWLTFSKVSGIYNLINASVYWRLSGVNISGRLLDKMAIYNKIKSLFMFVSFLENSFSIQTITLKKFSLAHLKNLLASFTFLETAILYFKLFNRNSISFKTQLFLIIFLERIKKRIKNINYD